MSDEENKTERIESFPWILQTVSSKLMEIAKRLEVEEGKGLRIPVTDKLVKEALLAALAASGPGEEDPVDSLMKIIKQHR